MKQHYLWISLLISSPLFSSAQTQNVQNASIPKDAAVNVNVTDFKKNVLPNEIVVFKSKKTDKEYQGLTNESGRFSVRLPAGDVYELYILGFKDSTAYNILDIPAISGNASYKKPFEIDLEFQPAKNWVLEGVNYETGKAELEEESFVVLDELVAYLNRKDDERIEVQGHTDNVGSATSNLKLSDDRANTVRAYLLMKGIDPSRVTAKGYGMSQPVSDNKTAEGRAENRRTEVKSL